jgi:hypothetical protein
MISSLKNILDGFLFSLGIFVFFSLIVGIYAFVEPTVSPNENNYTLDSNSPINIMYNKVMGLENPGGWDCTLVSSYSGSGQDTKILCPTGYKLITGGCDLNGHTEYANNPVSNGWHCWSSGEDIYAYAWCCK